MRGKKAKKLRKIAKKESEFNPRMNDRVMYQDLKTMYKKGDIKING